MNIGYIGKIKMFCLFVLFSGPSRSRVPSAEDEFQHRGVQRDRLLTCLLLLLLFLLLEGR